MIGPLAIIQARMGSTRLPGKLMLPFPPDRNPILHVVWERTVEAFHPADVVVAYPDTPANDPIRDWCRQVHANAFPWGGPENDVLGRFHACAHRYRWHPDSVIVRVTPDDPFKTPSLMRRVAEGERLPVEFGAEAFTLAMLDAAHEFYPQGHPHREHLTHALFPTNPPAPGPGPWTVDTHDDYIAACSSAPCRPSKLLTEETGNE